MFRMFVRLMILYVGWTIVVVDAAYSLSLGDLSTEAAIHLGSTACLSGFLETSAQCFETYLPTAGTWMIEVSVPVSVPSEPRLELSGGTGKEWAFDYLGQLPQSLLLEVRKPETYRFCVAAQDPQESLGAYKITSYFAARTTAKEGDPKEDELIADPKSLTCDENGRPPELDHLCQRSLADDHGDTFHCATPVHMGSEVEARLSNDSGDDEDLFTFALDELQTVEIKVLGEADSFVGLYSREGYLLKADGTTRAATSLRLVKTLSRGRYFLRVGSRYGEEGSYRLTVGRPDE